MPPIAMEADAIHQGCLPFCKLYSRSLAVGRTAIQLQAHTILRLRTRGLRNLKIAQMCYTISRSRTRAIPRLPGMQKSNISLTVDRHVFVIFAQKFMISCAVLVHSTCSMAFITFNI